MLTVSDANFYFGPKSHLASAEWHTFPEARRVAALAQARRILNRMLGREMMEDTTGEHHSPREDLALFEQALYMLRNLPAAGDVSGFASQDPDDVGQARQMDPGILCDEARRWLVKFDAATGPRSIVTLRRG
jgi:hypothetical protein